MHAGSKRSAMIISSINYASDVLGPRVLGPADWWIRSSLSFCIYLLFLYFDLMLLWNLLRTRQGAKECAFRAFLAFPPSPDSHPSNSRHFTNCIDRVHETIMSRAVPTIAVSLTHTVPPCSGLYPIIQARKTDSVGHNRTISLVPLTSNWNNNIWFIATN